MAAEGGLLEEAGDEFVVLHLVHVLLPQRPFAGEAVGHVLRRRGVVGRVNVSHGPPQPPLASAGEQQPGRAGVGGGGGRGGSAEVRWWRRWPGRAWPALRCSELGAEPRSLALRLSRSLAGPTLTDSPEPGARASYSRLRQEAARSGAAHCACPESKRVYGCTRAGWDRSARYEGARGASLGPFRGAELSSASLHRAGHESSGVPVSLANSRGRRSRGGPGDAQPRKKPGGAGPSPLPPASFPPFSSASSSLFFLLLSFRSSCLASSSSHLPPPTPSSLLTLSSFWDGSSVPEEPGTGPWTPLSLAGT